MNEENKLTYGPAEDKGSAVRRVEVDTEGQFITTEFGKSISKVEEKVGIDSGEFYRNTLTDSWIGLGSKYGAISSVQNKEDNYEEVQKLIKDPEFLKFYAEGMTPEEIKNVSETMGVNNGDALKQAFVWWQSNIPKAREANDLASGLQKVGNEYRNLPLYAATAPFAELIMAKTAATGVMATAGVGAIDGAISAAIIRAAEDNVQALDASAVKYTEDIAMGAGGGAGGAALLHFAGQFIGSQLKGVTKTIDEKGNVVNVKKDGTVTNEPTDAEVIANTHENLFSDIMLNEPNPTVTDVMNATYKERAKVKEQISKADSDIKELESQIKEQLEKIELNMGKVLESEGGAILKARSGVKSDKVQEKYTKQLFKSGKFTTTKSEELEEFINGFTGKAKEAGVEVKLNRDIQKTKEALKDFPELVKDFELANTAKKMLDSNKSKELLDTINTRVDEQVKKMSKEEFKLIDSIKTKQENLNKQLKKLNKQSKEQKKALVDLKLRSLANPDEEVDLAVLRYSTFVNKSNRDYLRMNQKAADDIERIAQELGDTDTIEQLNKIVALDLGDDVITRGELKIDNSLQKIADEIDVDPNSHFYSKDNLIGNLNRKVSAIGTILENSGDDLVVGWQRKNITNTVATGDGKLTATGGTTVNIKTQNEFNGKLNEILIQNFQDYKVNHLGKSKTLMRDGEFKAMSESDFEDLVHQSLGYLEGGHKVPDNIPEPVVKAARELIELYKDISIRNINIHPTASPAQKAAARAIVEEGGNFKRVPNDDFYAFAEQQYGKDNLVRTKEGGVVKAEPAINEKYELAELKAKEEADGFLVKSDKERKAKLEKDIADIDKLKRDGLIDDAWVDAKIKSFGDTFRHSNMLSKLWYASRQNASKRTMDGQPKNAESKLGFTLDELRTTVDELKLGLDEQEVKWLEKQIERERKLTSGKNKGQAGVDNLLDSIGIDISGTAVAKDVIEEPFDDIIKSRSPLDTTYEYSFTGPDGVAHTVSARNFYNNNVSGIAESMVIDRSAIQGMYYSGYASKADYIKEAEELLEHVYQKNGSREDTAITKGIKSVVRKQTGKAQYDRGTPNSAKGKFYTSLDAAKNLAVTDKLGYLVFAQTADSVRAASEVGFWQFMKSTPDAWRATKKFMRGEADPNDHLLQLYMHSTTYSKLFNTVGNAEAGRPDILSKEKSLPQALRAATGKVASYLTKISSYFDVLIRTTVLDATMNRAIRGEDIKFNLEDHGFTPKMMDLLKDSGSKYSIKNQKGEHIGIDWDKMYSDDAKMAEEITSAFYRAQRRAVGTPDFDSLPWWTNSPAYAIFGQFKSWILSQVGNSFQYGFGHMPLKKFLYVNTLLTTFGSMYHMGMSYIKYGDDKKKFDELMSPANIIKGGISNNPFTAAPMYVYSALEKAVGTMIGVDLAGQLAGSSTRSPYAKYKIPFADEVINVPFIGTGERIFGMIDAFIDMTQGNVTEKTIDKALGPTPNSIRRGVTLAAGAVYDLD